MNTRLKKRESEEIPEDKFTELAERLGVSVVVTEILAGRGCLDYETAYKFLNPSVSDLHDPSKLVGITALISRLEQAIANQETVIVYGDYDVDGICASAMFHKYLYSRGLETVVYIPNRVTDGYGLSTESLERIVEEYLPDLILTCDCGISAYEEVEFLHDLGIDVLITDHHEVPVRLPDCTLVNPKLCPDDYPFVQLCGAGVVFKIITAMSGLKEAMKYIDLCALATIADLMPLIDENRAIVSLGISAINRGECNYGLKKMLRALDLDHICSSDLAYKISPRLNAAGRMNDAVRAYRLLITDDDREANEIIAGLNADNDKRRMNCETMYREAVEDLEEENLIDNYAIILTNPAWERGLTSIVAAQLAGAYYRPAFLLVETNGRYKGTARSIEGINLYDVLASVSDLLIEFGGHRQAAGFSLEADKLVQFKERVNDYIRNNYDHSYFIPVTCYDAELECGGLTLSLAYELERLEPFGHTNPRPVFKVRPAKLYAERMKNKPQHLVLNADGSSINAFNKGRLRELFRSKLQFEFAVELSLNKYKGSESASLTLNSYDIAGSGELNDALYEGAKVLQLKQLNTTGAVYKRKKLTEIKGMMDGLYGTLVLAGSCRAYLTLLKSGIAGAHVLDVKERSTVNNINSVIIGSELDFPLKNFRTIILLDEPICEGFIAGINKRTRAEVIVADAEGAATHELLSVERGDFIKCYQAFVDMRTAQFDLVDIYYKYGQQEKIGYAQFVFAALVFMELGVLIFDENDKTICVNPGNKTSLDTSGIYNYIRKLKNGLVT